MNGSTILSAFQQLRQWLADWGAAKREKREQEKQAIRVLLGALTKTQLYLGDLNSGKPADRAREQELANAWADAAGAFFGLNENVAPLLQIKSEAWARPEQWSEQRLDEAGVTIEAISALARKLLAGEDPSASPGTTRSS